MILSTSSASIMHFADRMFVAWSSQDSLAASLPASITNFTWSLNLGLIHLLNTATTIINNGTTIINNGHHNNQQRCETAQNITKNRWWRWLRLGPGLKL